MKLNDTVGRTDRRFGCGVLRGIGGLAGGWPFSESHAALESITAAFVSPLTEPALREQVGAATRIQAGSAGPQSLWIRSHGPDLA
jgi:hypothetical protein